ncbi:MAG: hypothetical protein CSA25_01535 [Desulfobacter postgatei]|uniref:Uncharacterized protein n=1 Tax=Desulfobacter postgatei TaxID=2293 RepID=A0A2G6MSV6_9BACT|nr:MAG: hypothetical protein CSA25_01535 [Desulfobacter postgatei]
MKITDPQVILNGEKDLISSVQKDLDLDAVKDLFKKRLTARALSARGGRIVVHDNEVAFRLDYEINLNGSLLFDRNGNLLEESETTAPQQSPQDEDETWASDLDDDLSKAENIEDSRVGEMTDTDLENRDKDTDEAGQDIDDDLSDILQENRSFWEKEKE